jgi:hypothetical protein
VNSSFGDTPPENYNAEAQAKEHTSQTISEQRRSLYSFPNSLVDLCLRQSGKTRNKADFNLLVGGAPVEAEEPMTGSTDDVASEGANNSRLCPSIEM